MPPLSALGKLDVMESFSTTTGGLLLRIRRVEERGWEASISGIAPVLNEKTARNIAEKVAHELRGIDPGKIIWTRDPK